jgi:hypothetical protein
MATWHDLESARDQWVDAPLSDDVLETLLEVAKSAVIAYAPALPEPEEEEEEDIPTSYRYAQLMQTRNLWNVSRVDSAGSVGEGEFVIQPRPLDWHVKQVLRPARGVPRVG